MSRPVVLTLARFYAPGYKAGGPIRSIANMVAALSSEFDFRILCTDRDRGDDVPYRGQVIDDWTDRGDHAVRYLSPDRQRMASILEAVEAVKPDVVYLNSFFDPLFSVQPALALGRRRAGTPAVVLAPRGEFSRGALRIKAVKKSAYLVLARMMKLHDGVHWQASTSYEAADIRRTQGQSARIHIACDFAHLLPPPAYPDRAPGTPLQVIFLSRISPMKNLEGAIAVLRGVAAPVAFDVYGYEEDAEYVASCKRLAAKLPPHIRIRFLGALPHQQVAGALARYDLMFVPTRGENFGHVFLEALAAGTPVLTSDQTAWRDLEAAGVGWSLPLSDVARFQACVEAAASWDAVERSAYRARALAYARAHAMPRAAVEATRALFLSAATAR